MNVAFIVQTVFLINNVKRKIPSNENNTYRLATKFFLFFLEHHRPCSVVSFIYLFKPCYSYDNSQQFIRGYLLGIN